MRQYTIYRNPRDYPGRCVVRGWTIVRGEHQHELIVDAEPLAIVDTVEEARAAVPPGLVRLDRLPGDDPVIVEVWL